MRKAGFHPFGDSIPAVGKEHCCGEQSNYERDQCISREVNPVTDLIRSGESESAKFGGQKNCSNHEDGETADVEDSFDRPDGDLGGEGQILAARDQVRANHFSSAAEQSERGEPDHRGRNQSQDGGVFPDRTEKDLPANRTQEISQIDVKNAVKNVVPMQAILEKFGPIEILPGAELEVNQPGE